MAADTAVHVLRAADPAAAFEPLREDERVVLRDRVTSISGDERHAMTKPPRRMLRLAIALGAAALLTAGLAWAAGALSPLALFQANPQSDGSAPGSLWDQRVIAGSVKDVGSVEIPKVGPVAFWYGRTAQGGWCAGLRLRGGDWLGTGKNPLDGGGTVPGCFPTREMINKASANPVLVINGFDYVESDADARSVGGGFWRIRYGRITTPGAARITDLVSGKSTEVIAKNLFLLAMRDPDASRNTPLHLVAYNRAEKVVADDCPNCPG